MVCIAGTCSYDVFVGFQVLSTYMPAHLANFSSYYFFFHKSFCTHVNGSIIFTCSLSTRILYWKEYLLHLLIWGMSRGGEQAGELSMMILAIHQLWVPMTICCGGTCGHSSIVVMACGHLLMMVVASCSHWLILVVGPCRWW